jgi:C4-dicarboxylate-specific signal transduction histidine kinase
LRAPLRAGGSEIGTKAACFRNLERIERYCYRLGGFARKPGGKQETERSGSSTDHQQVQSWLEALKTCAPNDPAFSDGVTRLTAEFARMEEIGARTEPTSTDGAPARETLSAMTSILDLMEPLEERLRTDLTQASKALLEKWMQLNFMAILSTGLAVTLALVLFAYDRSVTERKKAEAGEHLLRAELAHVGRLSVVGEMGTKVAHELNQPLGAIHNYIAGCVRRLQQRDGQQRDGENGDMIQALSAAAEETKRASSIIQGMREFVRNAEPRTSMVEINDLVREVLPLLSAELHESRVEPELQLAEDLDPILVDRIQIGQVLVNLIRNSLEAMRGVPVDERRLILRTSEAPENRIEVFVEDTGSGLPTDLLPSLFQPFHTTKPKGMGMGLAICRTIVEAHGGWIRAESRPGRGAIFRFQLPCPAMVVTP